MDKKRTKYIFVTGGVVSSLGKGIVAASLGRLLKSQGFNISIQKFDPYLNIDPGTMSPFQHGEVFVTEDGCETDLDLGHYERFIDQNLTRVNNVTSGMIFWEVLTKERKGDYLGHTVQIIPHVTDVVKKRITQVNRKGSFDVVITELGGTVGDIESQAILEAIRQFENKYKQDCIHIHVTLVPYLNTSGEYKTKPTQHSVKELRQIGIHPDIIVCRSDKKITKTLKNKIAMFCDVDPESVVSAVDATSIYEVPLILEKEGLDSVVMDKLGLISTTKDLDDWKNFVKTIYKKGLPEITIGIVGKYTSLSDSYISIVESLRHAGVQNKCSIQLKWIDAEILVEEDVDDHLSSLHGILIPGGFGKRGIEGKILATQYSREHKIPFLGLCLGMHIAVIEFARHVLKLKDANSSEFDEKTRHPVIDFLPNQVQEIQKGGTMRLGAYPCKIKEGTLLFDSYQKSLVSERHRHRYEFNNKYRQAFEEHGMVFSGTSPDDLLIEVIEMKEQPWFVACQFHPEFKSRPLNCHPLFESFVSAMTTYAS